MIILVQPQNVLEIAARVQAREIRDRQFSL